MANVNTHHPLVNPFPGRVHVSWVVEGSAEWAREAHLLEAAHTELVLDDLARLTLCYLSDYLLEGKIKSLWPSRGW